MAEEKRPGLTAREETDGRLRKLLVDYDGNVLLDETVFAYDDLIHFLDRPVKELRKQIHKWLALSIAKLSELLYQFPRLTISIKHLSVI